jgi:hypothetical protein
MRGAIGAARAAALDLKKGAHMQQLTKKRFGLTYSALTAL